jgi:hypothetical protein
MVPVVGMRAKLASDVLPPETLTDCEAVWYAVNVAVTDSVPVGTLVKE